MRIAQDEEGLGVFHRPADSPQVTTDDVRRIEAEGGGLKRVLVSLACDSVRGNLPRRPREEAVGRRPWLKSITAPARRYCFF